MVTPSNITLREQIWEYKKLSSAMEPIYRIDPSVEQHLIEYLSMFYKKIQVYQKSGYSMTELAARLFKNSKIKQAKFLENPWYYMTSLVSRLFNNNESKQAEFL